MGILEPTFQVNTAALMHCHAQQMAPLDNIEEVSAAAIFDANRSLHETIAE